QRGGVLGVGRGGDRDEGQEGSQCQQMRFPHTFRPSLQVWVIRDISIRTCLEHGECGGAMAAMSNTDRLPGTRVAGAALILVGAKLGLHLLVAGSSPYEFHRDEFLYFAMGNHLRMLHMDFPPLIALLAEAVRFFSESSLVAYRLVPALAGAILVLLAVLTVREMGGGPTAQVMTAVLLIFNPLFLRTASLFQPVVLDQVWWMLGFLALVRLENTGEPRWWLMLGLAAGLGLLSKFSILFFGLAVLIGLLVTSQRRALLTRWPWITLGVALLVGAPSIIGQVTLGHPLLEQMAGLKQAQLARISFTEYLSDQVIWGPVAFLFALAGAVALLGRGPLARYRLVGVTALAAFALFASTRGKSYYVGPIYPVLFAAASVWADQLARPRLRALLVWGVPAATVVYCLAILPFGLPILPPEPMARYARATGIGAGVRANWGEQLALPQDYADMLGWREKAEAVAAVYRALPPEEQAETVLYGANYGQAGALEFYGRQFHLPPVISLAGSFYLFGPGSRSGRTLILLGVEREDLDDLTCASLEEVTRVRNRWAVPGEDDVPVLLCRQPSLTPQEIWRRNRPEWG
ncbi:MAG: hypothetical protein H6R40_1571, partial [Gemmatimonadetes bacterium]|nr:hypothetical protein [Gemmatimonadota bacterium]